MIPQALIGALILPDPLECQSLISWTGATRVLLTERGGPAFIEDFVPAALQHSCPSVRARVSKVLASGSDPVRAAVALLGAAHREELAVYVRAVDTEVAYETSLELWRNASPFIADPVTLALSGRLSIVVDLLPHKSVEAKLAGAPMYVNRDALRKLLTRRVSSEAERLKTARQLVDRWRAAHDGPMRKREFRATIAQLFPGVSGREQDRLWDKVAPVAWRQPGARKA